MILVRVLCVDVLKIQFWTEKCCCPKLLEKILQIFSPHPSLILPKTTKLAKRNLCRFQSVLDEDLRQSFFSSSSLVLPCRSLSHSLSVCVVFVLSFHSASGLSVILMSLLSLNLWSECDSYELGSRSCEALPLGLGAIYSVLGSLW